MSALGVGARWWRTEAGRWWRTEDVPDVALAHRTMNQQYRIWMRLKRRTTVEVQQSINLLKSQQRSQRQMQVMQLHAQRQRARRGGYGRYGYGGGFGLGMGGASPFVTYRTMQWSELKLKINQGEVDDAFEVPLAFLMNPENHQIHSKEFRGMERSYYAMPFAEHAFVVEADRAAEFNPVKNEEGDDSPETAQRAMCANFAAWLKAADARVADDAKIGDSIAINGVCLTVARLDGRLASFDISGETLTKSTLGKLNPASQVNIELALKATDRFGGHIVAGHINGTATIKAIIDANI